MMKTWLSLALVGFLAMAWAGVAQADKLYLVDGRILTGTVEKVENGVVHFRTALGVETLLKEQIWKMLDDTGKILYEDPSKRPAAGKKAEKTGTKASHSVERVEEPEPVAATQKGVPQARPAAASAEPVPLRAQPPTRRGRLVVHGGAGTYELTDKDVRKLWKGTMGWLAGGGASYILSSGWGVNLGYSFSGSSLEPKEWDVRGTDPPAVELSHQILRVGVRRGVTGLIMGAGYVSVTRKLKTSAQLQMDEQATANGFYGQFGVGFPLGGEGNLIGELLGTADFAGEDNWAGGVSLRLGIAVAF